MHLMGHRTTSGRFYKVGKGMAFEGNHSIQSKKGMGLNEDLARKLTQLTVSKAGKNNLRFVM